jgi:hypothetical protein
MRFLSAMLLMTSISSTAFAGTGEGVIRSIWASSTSPYVMFDFTTPMRRTHRCNRSERFSIDLRGIGGRASYEILLMAKSEKLTVSVEGLGTCNIHDAENVKSIEVQ